MGNHHTCSICGREYAEEDIIIFDDELVCETCLAEETVICADCGTRIWDDQNAGSSELPLCQRCFDRDYTTCERCGAVLPYNSVFYLDDEEDYKDTPQEMMDQAKNHRLGRYTCVNLTNANTVEIRIFRGTLKYNTFLATLQLVSRLCDAAIFCSDAEIHAMSWLDFIAGITEPELIQYLKERRLYLSEPVESEAEV